MPENHKNVHAEAVMDAPQRKTKPELLCPAGSVAAFDAAIEGGADAIYIGGLAFNARINAKNFTEDEMRSAINRAHSYGVKVYIAANTLIYDRELEEYLTAAKKAYLAGADALIVADLGAATLLRKHIPDLELHASTQLSGHNLSAAKRLSEAGFSRMVLAREMCREDIKSFCQHSPIESEVFVHGALCVCHSGQCLFSSLVGGRSGNRGECAQPCRLPFGSQGKKESYPLSLKDLCLAAYVPELSEMGVNSFKIEGRMKSPEYVRDVTAIWRRLLDENRGATHDELYELARIFSRDGFTDGYYRKKIDSSMLGVRSEKDKQISRELIPFEGLKRKIPLDFKITVKRGLPVSLTVLQRGVTVTSDPPEEAISSPCDRSTLLSSLSRLGGTAYELRELVADIDSGVMVPVSKLNALRREAIMKISSENIGRTVEDRPITRVTPKKKRTPLKTAVFYDPSALTEKAKDFFDIIYLPLDRYNGETKGVLLPPVIYDSEAERLKMLLNLSVEKGAKHALISNLGHIDLASEAGLCLHGDFRLNASNNPSAAVFEELGFEDIILSPELTLARIRDIGGRTSAIVYGRIPLMVTEKCVGKELGDCGSCKNGKLKLTDRRRVSFPVLREWEHRSLIVNSIPTFMADKENDLKRAGISMRHFIFTVESPAEVDKIIELYKKCLPSDKQIKRIN